MEGAGLRAVEQKLVGVFFVYSIPHDMRFAVEGYHVFHASSSRPHRKRKERTGGRFDEKYNVLYSTVVMMIMIMMMKRTSSVRPLGMQVFLSRIYG